MKTSRLEAFTDAVIAIIMTIMVLELKIPTGHDWSALAQRWPVFLSYLLSFLYLAIYWNNHHHMLHATVEVNGRVLWANQVLLFWLSLIPFATAWLGEGHLETPPAATYGAVLLMSALSYSWLQSEIITHEGPGSRLKQAVGRDRKGRVSVMLYALAILVSFVLPALAVVIYACAGLMWLVPDKRIEEKHMPAAE